MNRALAVLERPGGVESLVDSVTRRAAAAGAPVEYLGVQPLFEDTRLYVGETEDWVLAPAEDDAHVRSGAVPIPRAQLAELNRLLNAGLNFPRIYTAHELPDTTTTTLLPAVRPRGELDFGRRPLTISPDVARSLVGPPPQAAKTLRTSAKLGAAATGAFKLVAGLAAGAVVAPFALPAALLASLPTDPVIFGAIPLDGSTKPGTPAVWFVLARWSW